MKLSKTIKFDVKEYFKSNLSIYISFLIVFLVGIIFGIVNALSSENYLKILTKDNKILYSFINGSIKIGSVFGRYLWKLILPLFLIFVLGLNFYLSLFSYLIIGYQSSVLIMSIFAIISTYGLSGVLNVFFIVLPINLIYMAVLIIFATENLKRSYRANKLKCFAIGYAEDKYIFSLALSIGCVILICLFGSVIIPLFLKNAIFLIF